MLPESSHRAREHGSHPYVLFSKVAGQRGLMESVEECLCLIGVLSAKDEFPTPADAEIENHLGGPGRSSAEAADKDTASSTVPEYLGLDAAPLIGGRGGGYV